MRKGDPPSEDEVKRAAEVKEWIGERITELETELARLRDMQSVVDSMLRKTSFVPAAELKANSELSSSSIQQDKTAAAKSQSPSSRPTPTSEESRQLRRSKDGMLVASAFITPERIIVVPSSDVRVSQSVPPFQTFFVNRILKGYETKDKELAESGKLSGNEVFAYSIEEEQGNISKVTVTNYRDKARLNEILSTINWALARMLERKE